MGLRRFLTPPRSASRGRPGVVARRRLAGERREAVHRQLVWIAIGPILAGLVRSNGGVLRLLEVLRRMLVRRIVAAADVAARHAKPQMDPFATAGEALLAAVPARVHRFAARIYQLFQMRALLVHGSSSAVFPIVRVADGERSSSYRHYPTASTPSFDVGQVAPRPRRRTRAAAPRTSSAGFTRSAFIRAARSDARMAGRDLY